MCVKYIFSIYNAINRYKGEGVINACPEKVWECLKPEPNGIRVKWDSNVKKFELLEQVTEVNLTTVHRQLTLL